MKYIYEISPERGENYYEVYFCKCHDETLVPVNQKILATLYTRDDLLIYIRGLDEICQIIPASVKGYQEEEQ
jgi:hypothetical protein